MKVLLGYFKVLGKVIQGIIYMACLLGTLNACQDKRERLPEVYILPESYKGAFYIVHNVRSGSEGVIKDGAQVYEIPESGVLVTQERANEGWVGSDKITFFHRKVNGDLLEIKHRWSGSLADNAENRADLRVTIFGGGLGEIRMTVGSCAIPYRGFHIGTKTDVLDGVNHFSIESVIQKRLIECKD